MILHLGTADHWSASLNPLTLKQPNRALYYFGDSRLVRANSHDPAFGYCRSLVCISLLQFIGPSFIGTPPTTGRLQFVRNNPREYHLSLYGSLHLSFLQLSLLLVINSRIIRSDYRNLGLRSKNPTNTCYIQKVSKSLHFSITNSFWFLNSILETRSRVTLSFMP